MKEVPFFIADELIRLEHHPNLPSPVSDETFKFELVQNADEMKITDSEYVDLSDIAKDSYYIKQTQQWDSVNDKCVNPTDQESSIVILKPPFVSEMNQALMEDPIFQSGCLNVKENYFM